jgi:hypothetical protein
VCGTAAQVATGAADFAYGDWQIQTGIFSVSVGLPGGAGSKVQDYGTNGLWSTTAPVTAAPEIDANSAVAALLLLLGSIAVMRGRVPSFSERKQTVGHTAI